MPYFTLIIMFYHVKIACYQIALSGYPHKEMLSEGSEGYPTF